LKRSPMNTHYGPRSALTYLSRSVVVAGLVTCLYGCGSGMQGVLGSGIDSVLTTSSTPAPQVTDPNGPAILMALTQNPTPGVEWENAEDGARGKISSVDRKDKNGVSCLAFRSTRESFDGIHLYEGEACQTPRGIMALRSLTRL
jgi:hypothetical protein